MKKLMFAAVPAPASLRLRALGGEREPDADESGLAILAAWLGEPSGPWYSDGVWGWVPVVRVIH
jgi:hypothetical protein